jgi:hypothetical protein
MVSIISLLQITTKLTSILNSTIRYAMFMHNEHNREETQLAPGSHEKSYNDKLQNLSSSLNIIRVIKSRRMRWVSHVARMGRRGMLTLLVAKLKRKRLFMGLRRDGRTK